MKQVYTFDEQPFIKSTPEELVKRKLQMKRTREIEGVFRIYIAPDLSKLREKISKINREERDKKNKRRTILIEPIKSKKYT